MYSTSVATRCTAAGLLIRFSHLLDGVVAELHKTTLACLAVCGLLGPLPGCWVKEVVTPQLLHHLNLVSTKLGSIHLSKGGEGEGPGVQASTEGHGALVRVHLRKSLHRQKVTMLAWAGKPR